MSSPGCRKLVQRWKTKHRYWSSRLRLLITSFTQTFWTSSMTMKLIFISINRSIWWTCSKITWIMVLILRGKNVSRPCNRYCFTFYRLPCSNNKIVYTLSSNEFLSPLKSSFTPVTISEYVTVCRGRRALLLISSPPRCLLPPLFTSQQGKPITICTWRLETGVKPVGYLQAAEESTLLLSRKKSSWWSGSECASNSLTQPPPPLFPRRLRAVSIFFKVTKVAVFCPDALNDDKNSTEKRWTASRLLPLPATNQSNAL